MTDKLKGIEPGRRYKVEFEAITKYVSVGIVNFEITPGTVTTISADEIAHPSFKIEPIEEPLAIGMIVAHPLPLCGSVQWEVASAPRKPFQLADYEEVALFRPGNGHRIVKVSDLERVK